MISLQIGACWVAPLWPDGERIVSFFDSMPSCYLSTVTNAVERVSQPLSIQWLHFCFVPRCICCKFSTVLKLLEPHFTNHSLLAGPEARTTEFPIYCAWHILHVLLLWFAGGSGTHKTVYKINRPSRLAALENEADASVSYYLLPVLAAVSIAGLGAFLFGYHLGVVNGPLEMIAADLGIARDAVLQGLVSMWRILLSSDVTWNAVLFLQSVRIIWFAYAATGRYSCN